MSLPYSGSNCSVCYLLLADVLLGQFFDVADEAKCFSETSAGFQRITWRYIYPRNHESSKSPLREPQILQIMQKLAVQ
jgi:hypothetical protein